MNKEKGQTSAIVLVAIAAIVIGGIIGWSVRSPNPTAAPVTSLSQNQEMINVSRENLNKDMRKLWEDHIVWTRAYLIAAAYDNKDADSVANRLLKNQEDIGDAIKPYYGEEAGDSLTTLLKTHITTAVELVTVAKKGDQNAQKIADDKWYANANEIADFLSSANPNWPKDEARVMMKEHLDLTKQEAVDILTNKYDSGIADYDKVHEQILNMADMLIDGIVKQFPEKFK